MAGRSSFYYDVFFSFRGEDTRLGFTGNLYSALSQRGIHSFFDDKEIRKGDEKTPSLVKAIKESKIAIIVLSKTYAFSSFCLDELSTILDCFEENKGQLVLPVFFNVDPSDVRHCRGSYGEGLAKLGERFKGDNDKLIKWRTALQKAANIAGFTFKNGNGYEYQFIWSIFKEVSLKINRTLLHVANYPVGLESRVDEVISRLNVGSDDTVQMVGIHGIGGIGKSTIARAVYNSISNHFEGFCCFLENVRENSRKYGLGHLQQMVLSDILGDEDFKLRNVSNGMPMIEHRLCSKKVLLVLDDVDKIEQLQAIAGAPNWFGLGSRVIITTRGYGLLKQHEVKSTYEVEELNDKEARELLCWNAFKTDKVDSRYTAILNRAVGYASRLPLALEVIGSNLFGKGEDECTRTLDRYDRFPDKKIKDLLKVSYDSLEEDEGNVFLDIACFFNGHQLADVEDILSAHYSFSVKHSIKELIEKSLIKIDGGLMTLHYLIQDMGREIVRLESPHEPGKRSRLWFYEDVVQVLNENKALDFVKDVDDSVSDEKKKIVMSLEDDCFKGISKCMEFYEEDDICRLLFAENNRKTAEENYVNDPLDVDNLTKWGLPIVDILMDCGYQTPDFSDAKDHFDKAYEYFQRAVDVAPELHMKIHKSGFGLGQMSHREASASSKEKETKMQRSNYFKYDMFGWLILAAGIVACVAIAKSHIPPPPSG